MYSNGTPSIRSIGQQYTNRIKVPFWITATTVDIVIDVTLIILSWHMVWRLQLDYHQKTLATIIFSTRILQVCHDLNCRHSLTASQPHRSILPPSRLSQTSPLSLPRSQLQLHPLRDHHTISIHDFSHPLLLSRPPTPHQYPARRTHHHPKSPTPLQALVWHDHRRHALRVLRILWLEIPHHTRTSTHYPALHVYAHISSGVE